MKNYMRIWALLTLALSFEFWALNGHREFSFLVKLQDLQILDSSRQFSTAPGRTISLWLGWVGFGLMVLMNVYSMRKRIEFLTGKGKLSSWLNFHIFCGLLGPTLIFFHCGLKVRGMVGISFWSMVISLSSGIVGRYFFNQLSTKKNDFELKAQAAIEKLEAVFKRKSFEFDEAQKEKVLNLSLQHAGGFPGAIDINPFSAFVSSLSGDFRYVFREMPMPKNWPRSARVALSNYAMSKRKAQFIVPFETLMGYWHTFHFPFAVFMYVAAVIHIVSSLIFLT